MWAGNITGYGGYSQDISPITKGEMHGSPCVASLQALVACIDKLPIGDMTVDFNTITAKNATAYIVMLAKQQIDFNLMTDAEVTVLINTMKYLYPDAFKNDSCED